MARTSTNRRRSNLILKRLQGRILLQTTLFPVGVIAVLATAIVVLGRRLMVIAEEAGAPMPDLGPMLHGIVFLSAAMAAAIFYVSFRVSPRIAGPAWRVIQSLRRIREGDAAFCHVKKADGSYERRAVKTGETTDDGVIVTEGLAEGDEVRLGGTDR